MAKEPFGVLEYFHKCFKVNIWVWKLDVPIGQYVIEKKYFFHNEKFDETWMFCFDSPKVPGTLYHVIPLQDNRPSDDFEMQIIFHVKRKRALSPIRIEEEY
jgi:hypothetical protein